MKARNKLLESKGLTCSHIASECNIPECIVRKWMSQKEIPKSFQDVLDSYVRCYNRVSFLGGDQEKGLKMELPLSDYSALSKKAMEAGCSVGELIARKLDALGKEP